MTIRIITVEREYACGGGMIAARLAHHLGWKLWDHALSEEIARRLDCDCGEVEKHEERIDHHRLWKSFLRGSFEGSLVAPRLGMVDSDCIREITQKLVAEIADGGNGVIVGRGAAYYLGTREDAFHVFIYATFRERVRRLRSIGESQQRAMELAQTVDRDRAEFIQQHFQVEWPGRHHFHLMVNSGMGDETAARIILDAVARYQQRS
jgi:cytidylate kinase